MLLRIHFLLCHYWQIRISTNKFWGKNCISPWNDANTMFLHYILTKHVKTVFTPIISILLVFFLILYTCRNINCKDFVKDIIIRHVLKSSYVLIFCYGKPMEKSQCLPCNDHLHFTHFLFFHIVNGFHKLNFHCFTIKRVVFTCETSA